MEASDVNDVPTKGFDKAWWEKKRSSKAKGSGVGKALDAWNKAGLPPKGNITGFATPDQYEAGFAAIEQLLKALTVAKGKAKTAKDTVAAVTKYEGEVYKHEGALKVRYNLAKSEYKKARETLLQRTTAHLEADQADLKKIEALAVQAESAEKAATVAAKAGKTDELDRYAGQVETLLQQAKASHQRILNRAASEGPYEAREKQKRPDEWGVMEKDSKPLNHIFQSVSQNIFASTTAKNNAATAVEQIQDYLDAMRNFAETARMDVGEWITLMQKLAADTVTLTDETAGLGVNVRSSKSQVENLQQILNGDIDAQKLELAKVRRDAVLTHSVSAPREFKKFKKIISQRGRMPAEFEVHPQIAKAIKAIEENHTLAKSQVAEIERTVKFAEKTFEAIKKKAGN